MTKAGVLLLVPLLAILAGCRNPGSGGETVETVWWQEDADGCVQFRTNDRGYLNRSLGTWSERYLAVLDSYEIDTFKVSGSRWGGYGMMFCVQDFNNFYCLLINIDGYYSVIEARSGSFSRISDWTFSPLLNLGYLANNRLGVKFFPETTTYEVSINGVPATTFQDNTFHGGYYGYFLDILSIQYEDFPSEPVDVRFKAVRESEIQGLWFGDHRVRDLDSLQALAGYHTITGSLYIYDSALTNLDVLESLRKVGGDLRIENNDQLLDVSGLSGLMEVGQTLLIDENTRLPNLDGLHALVKIGSSLAIQQNEALVDLTGLANVGSIGGDLWIYDNDALTSIPAFPSLASVQKRVNLQYLDGLTAMSGLTALQSAGSLIISYNSILQTIDGLTSLETIGTDVTIERNAALTDFSGITGLKNIGDSLNVRFCGSLVGLPSFANLVRLDGEVEITYNDQLLGISSFPLVSSCRAITIEYNGQLKAISFPALELLSSLEIFDNPQLEELNLTSLGLMKGNASLSRCPLMLTLIGLRSLSVVQGSLSIGADSGLADLSGLESLIRVQGDFRIVNNSALTTLAGLENLSYVGKQLYINSNSSLLDTSGLSGLLDVGTHILFLDNDGLQHFELPSAVNLTGSVGLLLNDNLKSISTRLRRIGGSLTIDRNGLLESISGFTDLAELGSGLVVSGNSSLSELSGFDSLVSIGGSCAVEDNEKLESIDLPALSSIGGDFTLSDNENLRSVSGLEDIGSLNILRLIHNPLLPDLSAFAGLTSLRKGLYVERMNGLTTLGDFSRIQAIDGTLRLDSNYFLVDLGDLSSLTSIGALEVRWNDSLSNLDSLAALSAINGNLTVIYNAALVDIDGLGAVAAVGGDLGIDSNNALLDLDGLANLHGPAFGGYRLSIRGNDSLPTSLALAFRDRLISEGWNGVATISGNAP